MRFYKVNIVNVNEFVLKDDAEGDNLYRSLDEDEAVTQATVL